MYAETTAIIHDAVMEADAFSFSLACRAFAPHFHHAWVLGCVLSGQRRLIVQGRNYQAAAGDVVILRPGHVHACTPEGDAPFVWRGFHFRTDSLAAALLNLATAAQASTYPILSEMRLFDELLHLHALMGSPATPAQKLIRLRSALACLAERLRPAENMPSGNRQLALETLRIHLETHAPERISLEDMTVIACMDKFRLLRSFARMTGTTPYRYLESARVNRAQELLEQGVPTAEAALDAGFADQSHLVRAFRSRLGVTPGACRRRP